jgi:hypothetical protein
LLVRIQPEEPTFAQNTRSARWLRLASQLVTPKLRRQARSAKAEKDPYGPAV